jgi:hypothetical protein
MRISPGAFRRATMAAGSLAVFGLAVMAAAAPAAATPSAQASPAPSASAVPPFSSCAYGQPANTPLVVLVNARGRNAGFEATGPYDLVARHITGPFTKLVNYSNCRVWLHESSNPSAPGPSLCYSPYRFHATSVIGRAWKNAGSIVITGNTARCP